MTESSTRILLRELLQLRGLNPAKVLVMRHQPTEPPLRKVFQQLAIQSPEIFNAYQCFQREAAEKQLDRADYLASFIGHEPRKALFIGLYRNAGASPKTHAQYWALPENLELRRLGMTGFDGSRPTALQFDLQLVEPFRDWKGRLVVEWPGERSWVRWADKEANEFAVLAILDQNSVEPAMPAWNEIVWEWPQLKVQWKSWRAELATMKGVYFIFDVSDAKGYVGSACGEDNLLGRWTNYADTGHGGNKLLRNRDRNNFRFSILELVSPTAPPEVVLRLEQNWKMRLSTFAPLGLNEN